MTARERFIIRALKDGARLTPDSNRWHKSNYWTLSLAAHVGSQAIQDALIQRMKKQQLLEWRDSGIGRVMLPTELALYLLEKKR